MHAQELLQKYQKRQFLWIVVGVLGIAFIYGLINGHLLGLGYSSSFDFDGLAEVTDKMVSTFETTGIPVPNTVTKHCDAFSTFARFFEINLVVSQAGPLISQKLDELTSNLYSSSDHLSILHEAADKFLETLNRELESIVRDLKSPALKRLFSASPGARLARMKEAARNFRVTIAENIKKFDHAENVRDKIEGHLMDGEVEAKTYMKMNRRWQIIEFLFGPKKEVKEALSVLGTLDGALTGIKDMGKNLVFMENSLAEYRRAMQSYTMRVKWVEMITGGSQISVRTISNLENLLTEIEQIRERLKA